MTTVPPLTPRIVAPRRRFATARTIMALILREMSTRYGRTPGGYVWAVVEPLGTIIVLSLGFSLLLRTPSLGNNFLLFYASGYLPLNLYMTTSNTIARSVAFSRALLAYPTVTWVDAILARFLLNTLTSSLVTYLLIFGILEVAQTRTVITVEPMIESMCLAALLGLSVGTVNCVLFGLFPTWETVWSIATRPLFLASAVIYVYEDLPKAARDILWYNPLVHITGLMRTGIYPMYSADYVSVTYVLGCLLPILLLGLLLLGRHYKDVLNP